MNTGQPAPAGAPLILCATQRLARRLRLDAIGSAVDDVRAVPLILTLPQWLDATIEAALLVGEVPLEQSPARVLTEFQERLLWQQVLTKALRGQDEAALFSVDGLAGAAQEAHALCEVWQLDAPAKGSDEQQQFSEWRRRFLRLCTEKNWYDTSRYLVWQVDCIAAGAGTLPSTIERAGFDRFNPQEDRLFAALAARGVVISDRVFEAQLSQPVAQFVYPDAMAQFRAMAAWAREQLATARESPEMRIGLVVPDLEHHRAALTRALDQELDPPALRPLAAQTQRIYNVSLGEALARRPLVEVALQLVRIGLSAYRLDQTVLGRLVLGRYWSADGHEADARARFEARCRRKLSATTSLKAMTRLATDSRESGLPIAALCGHLERLLGWSTRVSGRRLYSHWATEFRSVLEALGWPGERSLSSHDFQARDAFFAQLAQLGELDPILGEVTAVEALATLTDACGRQLFQAETEGVPRIEVLGLLEAASEKFDALWVAGMTDDVWPPPVRTNPLLPAALQRAHGCPNASPDVQRAFAGGVHARFLQVKAPRSARSAGHLADMTPAVMAPRSARSAGPPAEMNPPQIVFSWPAFEGERGLRVSPLLDPAASVIGPAPAEPLAERLRRESPDAIESVPDFQAPPVAEAGRLKGGTWLMRAQAICPAWAFYQYRLGADELEAPADGLDARDRGSLLHWALETFWTAQDSESVRARSAEAQQNAVSQAVITALAKYDVENPGSPMSVRLRALEQARLQKLLVAWVEVELARPESFVVAACEEKHELSIEGIQARVTVDRIDALQDGRRVVIDYKTGSSVDVKSWAAARIVEPQLPIYATWAVAPSPLAAIAFAQIRADKMRFVGIAESANVLPNVEALADARKVFDVASFPDWASLLKHWQLSLSSIAAEIQAGDARVCFDNEHLLAHCPVRPLLRLEERRMQLDLGRAEDVA